MCIGPLGRRVDSNDRRIYQMLDEEFPDEVGGWCV